MQLQECINFLLNKAQQSVTQTFKEQLAPYNITPGQYAVLKCLWEEDGLSPKELATTISIDSPAVTGVLDRLEAKELIRREPDANDRRALKVFLTEQAVGLKEQIIAEIEKADAMVLGGFTTAEAAMLKQLLSKVANREES